MRAERHRRDLGDDRLAQVVGMRARDLAAPADMPELTWPYPSDLLVPAVHLVLRGAAGRGLPAAHAEVPGEFLRRMLPEPLAEELLVPAAHRAVPQVVDALDDLHRRLHGALADAVDEVR